MTSPTFNRHAIIAALSLVSATALAQAPAPDVFEALCGDPRDEAAEAIYEPIRTPKIAEEYSEGQNKGNKGYQSTMTYTWPSRVQVREDWIRHLSLIAAAGERVRAAARAQLVDGTHGVYTASQSDAKHRELLTELCRVLRDFRDHEVPGLIESAFDTALQKQVLSDIEKRVEESLNDRWQQKFDDLQAEVDACRIDIEALE